MSRLRRRIRQRWLMIDRDWLLILGGLLVIAVVIALAAVCSTGVLTAPDDPPEPEIEEVV
jgi:hypothetical protein